MAERSKPTHSLASPREAQLRAENAALRERGEAAKGLARDLRQGWATSLPRDVDQGLRRVEELLTEDDHA